MTPQPEAEARANIDAALSSAGWSIQNYKELNLYASTGVAVREFQLTTGAADYLLFINGKPCGAIEAKKVGHTLTGVETQTLKYALGLPEHLAPYYPGTPIPFLYESTGVETRFTNLLDPEPRSREAYHFHRPETLKRWLDAEPLPPNACDGEGLNFDQPSTLRARLRCMPELDGATLWPAQKRAIVNLEQVFGGIRDA